MSDSKKPTAINISPTFKLVFLSVLLLTIVFLILSVYISSLGQLTSEQKQLFENCSTTWKMGAGVIFGLLGGKTEQGISQKNE